MVAKVRDIKQEVKECHVFLLTIFCQILELRGGKQIIAHIRGYLFPSEITVLIPDAVVHKFIRFCNIQFFRSRNLCAVAFTNEDEAVAPEIILNHGRNGIHRLSFT